MRTIHLKFLFHDAAILAAVCAAALVVYLTTPRSQQTTQSWGSYTYAKTEGGFTLYADRPNTYFLFTPNTITYGRNDIIYDGAGNLFTENPDAIRNIVEQKTSVALLHSDPTVRTVTLTDSTLTLINPDVTGAIRVHMPDGTLIAVNKDARTISVSEPMRVEVLPAL